MHLHDREAHLGKCRDEGRVAARKARGVFYFSWVIPALIAVAGVVLFYLRFLWKLPPTTRLLFLIAGVWFVASAAGGEMVQGWWEAHGNSKN